MIRFFKLLFSFRYSLPLFTTEGIGYRYMMLLSYFWLSKINKYIIKWDILGLEVYEAVRYNPLVRDRLRSMESRFLSTIILRYIYIFPKYRTFFVHSNLHFNFLYAVVLEVPMQMAFKLSPEEAKKYIEAYRNVIMSIYRDELEYDPILDRFQLRDLFEKSYRFNKDLRKRYEFRNTESSLTLHMEIKEQVVKFFDCLLKDIEGHGVVNKTVAIEEYGRHSSYLRKYYTSFMFTFFTKMHHHYVSEYITDKASFERIKKFVYKMSELVAFSHDYNSFNSLFRQGYFYSWVYLYCIENNFFDLGQVEEYVRNGYKREDYETLISAIDSDALKTYFIKRIASMIEDIQAEHFDFIEGSTFIESILELVNPKIRPLEREYKESLLQGPDVDKRKYINFVYGINTIFSSLNSFQEICQQFVDAIEKNFHFTGAVLFLKDRNGEYAYPYTVSRTAIISRVLQMLPVEMSTLHIPMTEKDHLVIKAMTTKQYFISKDYSQFSPPHAKSFAPYIQKFAGIKIAGVFPVMYKGEVLGALVVSTNLDSFSRDDIYLIKVLSNIVGNAIQNWYLTHQLEEQVKTLEVSNKFKSEVLEIASHELRTPATIIRDALSMIREEDDKEKAMYINYARMAAARQILLVNNILNTSMIEGKSFELIKTSFALHSLIDKIAKELEVFVVDKKNLVIETDLESIDILADEQKIGQVIYNLIYNALKHTKKGYIKISAKRIDNQAQITVEDTGSGIDPSQLPTIFEKYTTATNDTNKKIFATGIGLYISRYIVNAHGGDIAVQSTVNKGSIFTVTLPIE